MNLIKKMNVNKVLVFWAAVVFLYCCSFGSSLKAQDSDCKILPAIINVTNDTIGNTSIFSSKKYHLYYDNVKTDEYAPIITRDGNNEILWFTSSRIYDKPQRYGFWNYFPFGWLFGNTPKAVIKKPKKHSKYNSLITDEKNFGDVFYSTRVNTGGKLDPWTGWSQPKILVTGSQNDNFIRGPITSLDGSNFIIAADRQFDTLGTSKNWDLYEFNKTSNGYSKPAPIDAVNTDDYWESQPMLSPNGKVLYFVSNSPGGQGGLDIWFSKKVSGNWDIPKPLNSINTQYDETFPYVGKDGNFYFSSNRPNGKGGFDIYIAENDENETWKSARNINNARISKSKVRLAFPATINTINDEVSPFLSDDGTSLYFSRKDNQGKYDIYACGFKKEATTETSELEISLLLKISLRDRCTSLDKDTTSDDFLGLVTVIIEDEAGNIIGKVKNGEEFPNLKRNSTYTLKVHNPIYICTPIKFTTSDFDELIEKELVVDIVGSDLGTIVFSDQSGVPYFITGYWRPLTKENWDIFQNEKRTGQLKGANYKDNDWRYDTVPRHIDAYFKSKIYDDINSKLPILQLKEITCGDSLVLRITINGYTDAHGLDGVYTGKNLIVNDLKIPHKQAFQIASLMDTNNKVVKFNIDGVAGGQNGNVMLSMLRAYYTYETIHNHLMSTSQVYRSAFESKRVKYEINGKGIYRQKDSIVQSDALMRRIEISLDAVPRDFDFEKQQPVKENCYYTVELKYDNRKEAEDIQKILVDYSFGYFESNLNVADDGSGTGAHRLFSNSFQSEAEAKVFTDSIQATLKRFPLQIKEFAMPFIKECNQFVVSFGVYQNLENAKKYKERLNQISGIEVEIVEIAGKIYSIRSVEKYRNLDVVTQNFHRINNKLIENKTPSFLRIIKLDN